MRANLPGMFQREFLRVFLRVFLRIGLGPAMGVSSQIARPPIGVCRWIMELVILRSIFMMSPLLAR